MNNTLPKALPFIKTLWEIRFLKSEIPSIEDPGKIRLRPLTLFLPSELMPTSDAQFLLKLIGIFHTASKKMVDELMQQVKGLAEFTEADTENNLQIAKMITWIKMLQQMMERLEKEIS